MRNITVVLLFLCSYASAQIRSNEVVIEERGNVRIEDPTYIVEHAEVKPSLTIQDKKTGKAFTVTPYFEPDISLGTHYVQGIKVQQRYAYTMPSGFVDNGYRMALDVSSHVTGHSNFFGTLRQQTGIRLHHGAHTDSGPGTITNVVGLHLIGLQSGETNLVNKWSLYQTNSGFNNFLQGKLRIGGTSEMGTAPSEQLEVNGNIDLSGNQYVSGNVGLGTNNPQARLHVFNGNHSYGAILANSSETAFSLYSKSLGRVPDTETFRLGLKYNNDERNGFISFYRGNSVDGGFLGFSTHGIERIRITRGGNVGIGTNNPSHKLHVAGQIRATSPYWADFVFDEDYELSPLEEVETFISENGHLEDIPSEEEVMKDGVNLTEMDAKLLQKIEELTLYVIEQNKQNRKQQAEILKLQQELVSLKNEMTKGE